MTNKIFLQRIFTLPLLLGLTACLPDMGVFSGPQYKPLTVEVAQMASPETPAQSPLLYCTIGRGTAKFGAVWAPFADAGFSLHQGEHMPVTVTRLSPPQSARLQVFFDGDGQKMIFCPVLTNAPPEQKVACSSIYTLEDDLQMGIKRTFDVPDFIRGGEITCAYDSAKQPPIITPPAGGN